MKRNQKLKPPIPLPGFQSSEEEEFEEGEVNLTQESSIESRPRLLRPVTPDTLQLVTESFSVLPNSRAEVTVGTPEGHER